MPAHLANSNSPPSSNARGLARAAVLGLLVVLVLVVAFMAGRQPTSQAAEPEKVDIAYLYVTGEAVAAKAWFDGAPSPGIPVQDALDKFAKQGYRVARLTENLRANDADAAMVILLQRVK